MKPKEADLVLTCFADFAHLNPNDPGLEKTAMHLIDIVAGRAGLLCRLEPGGNIEPSDSVVLHGEINHYLETLTHDDGVNPAISLEGEILVLTNLGGDKPGPFGFKPGLFLNLENTGIQGFIFAMFYCCGVFGAKKVVKCAGCGKYVFVAGHHRKYCYNSNTCRQTAHRLKKTNEDKMRENAKRRAEYKRRKLQ